MSSTTSRSESLLYIDTETWTPGGEGAIDLGAHAYARLPGARLLSVGWALGSGDVRLWCEAPGHGDATLDDLRADIAKASAFVAHNSEFDQQICEQLLGWEEFRRLPWHCTMWACRVRGFRGALEICANRILGEAKNAEGTALVKEISRMTAFSWEALGYTKTELLCRYNVQDVRLVQRLVASPHLRQLPVHRLDRASREMSLRMNASGVRVDAGLMGIVHRGLEEDAPRVTERLSEMTGHGIDDFMLGSTRPGIKAVTNDHDIRRYFQWWMVECERNGEPSWDVPNSRKPTLQRLATHPNPRVGPVADYLLSVRAATNSKFGTLGNRLIGGRLLGSFIAHGARTGRWTSKGVQLQNLPRLERQPEDVAGLRRDVKSQGLVPAAKGHDITPQLLARDLTRSVFVASEGREFLVSDFAQIECRVLHWMAGDAETIHRFATGQDVYEAFARSAFGLAADEPVSKERRLIAKTCVLGLGYGLGAKKLRFQFERMRKPVDPTLVGLAADADPYGYLQERYRQTNPRVTAMWSGLEQGFNDAMRGGHWRGCGVTMSLQRVGGDACVRLELPSGRCLYYWNPRVSAFKRPSDWEGDDPNRRRFLYHDDDASGVGVYGGKLTENVCQAAAADVMFEAYDRIGSQVPLALSVHDEIVADVPKGDMPKIRDFVEKSMTAPPQWRNLDGLELPLAVESNTCAFFHKF